MEVRVGQEWDREDPNGEWKRFRITSIAERPVDGYLRVRGIYVNSGRRMTFRLSWFREGKHCRFVRDAVSSVAVEEKKSVSQEENVFVRRGRVIRPRGFTREDEEHAKLLLQHHTAEQVADELGVSSEFIRSFERRS
jgi:hypothetical protein